MNKLIVTSESAIVYGTFKGKENQELFRCPKELMDTDLKKYINDNRMLVCSMESKNPFVDDDVNDTHQVPNKKLVGYYRLYFRGRWYGRWFFESDLEPSEIDCAGVDSIVKWLSKNFEKGCDYSMKEFFVENFKQWDNNRYLIKPFMSEHYKIMVDTTYGNHDYPVRIYVYKDNT